MNTSIKNKTTLVTGVSSGIGREIAQLLAERGARVFGTVRDPQSAEPISGVEIIRMDVTEDTSVAEAIQSIVGKAGPIHNMINNAGYALTGALEETSLEEAKQQFETNFFGVLRVTAAVLPGMRGNGFGRIVNISSVVGFLPSPYMGIYAASKHAVEAYTETLDHEVRKFGVRAVLIEPAFTKSNISHSSKDARVTLEEYAVQRKRMKETVGNNIQNGDDPYIVAKAVFQSLIANVPRLRYATWSNIMDQPVWFSVGRRPSTDGAPTNLKSNSERPGNGGTPALLVNYAFDGMTLGYAPDIDFLPGFYAKVCYGRGFDSGYRSTPTNSLKDSDMMGVAILPVDTDPLRVWFQWNRGFNIYDFPAMKNTKFGNTAQSVNLGAIDWYGIGAMSTLKKVGPGDLNFFVDSGMNITHPTNTVSANAMFQGLLTGSPLNPEAPTDKTGYAVLTGVRYDLPSKTKLGFEFNYGSKNWIPYSPAADDMWTAKVGTRGKVYEPYVIQELDLKPVSSIFAKAFFKLGYQYYDFEYTGSNNWVGAPIKISDITANTMLLQAPVKSAHDIYGTFEVHF